MRTSESIGQLAAALSAAQGAFENPDRNRTVTVRMKTGGSYSFAYATLDEIVAMARPALAANKLALIQTVETVPVEGHGQRVIVTTRLAHASGEWIESDISAMSSGEIQAIGSTITYLRRYSYVSLLGIASEEDDDGNAAAGNHTEKHERPKPQQPAKPQLTDAERAYVRDATLEILQASEDQLVVLAEVFKTKSQPVRDALKVPYGARLNVLRVPAEVIE